MGSYWIKGNDGKEYRAEDERIVIEWIQENRIAAFTQIKKEGENEFRAAKLHSEFASYFPTSSSSEVVTEISPPILKEGSPQVAEGAHLQVGLAFREGWQLFRENILLSYGGLIFWIVINLTIGFLPALAHFVLRPVVGDSPVLLVGMQGISYLLQLILAGPLLVGFYKFWLNMVDRRDPHLQDFLNGFEIWLPAMLTQWLKGLIFMGIIALSVPFFVSSFFFKFQDWMSGKIPPIEEWGWVLVGLFVLAFVIVVVMTLFWFVEFLLADRISLKVFRCFKLSAQLALRNIPGLALLFTLVTLFFIVACFTIVGVLIILPWLILSVVHGYRQLVPRNKES
ncbi:MAG: hypothetical protein K1X66_02715 [Verrucomicrobiae bacterium]|nr:hypothetical protein [Verrucomicrobiae bacterium]